MNLQIKAKIIQIMPNQSGTSAKGNSWSKQEFIVETFDEYPKKVCFNLWGDKVDRSFLKEGNIQNFSFNVESREFNGRWYTELRVWRVESADAAPRQERNDRPSHESSLQAASENIPSFDAMDDKGDDLPF